MPASDSLLALTIAMKRIGILQGAVSPRAWMARPFRPFSSTSNDGGTESTTCSENYFSPDRQRQPAAESADWQL